MRLTKLDLPFRFFGLVLGRYYLGLLFKSFVAVPRIQTPWYRQPIESLKEAVRLLPRIVASRALTVHRMYGVIVRHTYLGLSTFPKYTNHQIKEALLTLALNDLVKPLDVLRADLCIQPSSEGYVAAESFLDGKLQLPAKPTRSTALLNYVSNGRSTKSMDPEVRKMQNAAQYQSYVEEERLARQYREAERARRNKFPESESTDDAKQVGLSDKLDEISSWRKG